MILNNKLLNGKLSQGKHSQGGQTKRFKDTLKVSMKSFGITPNCLEYLSCAGNLEKALPHESLPPPFLVLTAQDSFVHRLISLAICTLTDSFLNHKVDQMVVIDYN